MGGRADDRSAYTGRGYPSTLFRASRVNWGGRELRENALSAKRSPHFCIGQRGSLQMGRPRTEARIWFV